MAEASQPPGLPAATLDELIPLVIDELRQFATYWYHAVRTRGASKRGSGALVLRRDENHAAVDAFGSELEALDEALERLTVESDWVDAA